MYPFRKSPYYYLALSERGKQTFPKASLLFLLIYWAGSLVGSIPAFCVVYMTHFGEFQDLAVSLYSNAISQEAYQAEITRLMADVGDSPLYILSYLFGAGVFVGCAFLFMLVLEKRPISQMGMFLGQGKRYGIPLFALLGAVGAALAVGILALTGAVSFTAPRWECEQLAFIAGRLVYTGSYVFFLWGACLPSMISHTHSVSRGVTVTVVWSILTYLSIPVENAPLFCLVNMVLYAIFLSLLTVRAGNVWVTVSFAAAWELAFGSLFGTVTYGGMVTPSFLTPVLSPDRILTHGGTGGFTAGYGVTVILVICLGLVLYLPWGKGQEKKEAALT